MEFLFKVRENSKVVNKTVYIAVGLKTNGMKEILGLWLGKNESSAFLDERTDRFKSKGRGRNPDARQPTTSTALLIP